MPEYDLVFKMDDDLEINPKNLKRALLASRPWQANTDKPTKTRLDRIFRLQPFTVTR